MFRFWLTADVGRQIFVADLEKDDGHHQNIPQGENQFRRKHSHSRERKLPPKHYPQQKEPVGYQSTSMRHPLPEHRPPTPVSAATGKTKGKKKSSFPSPKNNMYKPFDEEHEDQYYEDQDGNNEDGTESTMHVEIPLTNG